MSLWKRMLDYDAQAAQNRRLATRWHRRFVAGIALVGVAMVTETFIPGTEWLTFVVKAGLGFVFVAFCINPSKDERTRVLSHQGATIGWALAFSLIYAYVSLPGAPKEITTLAVLIAVAACGVAGAITSWLINR